MAEVVLGIGTSHGPMLVTTPEQWKLRAPFDVSAMHHYKGKTWSYNQLIEMRKNEHIEKQITNEVLQQRKDACWAAIQELSRVYHEVKPDVAVIIGNDQMEIFNDTLVPAFSVFYGDTIVNSELSEEHMEAMPPGIAAAVPGFIPQGGATYPAVAELGEHIIKTAIEDNFDVAAIKEMPNHETPHAFGFIYRQIMKDRPVPSVPILINTFYPPNQPTVRRCYAFGKSILKAIRTWKSDARVALFGSGGLTHFVIDESVDQLFFEAMRRRDIASVANLGENIFQAGTSEMKNWVPLAGAMAELGFEPHLVDYVPCYRSPAGTGNAMGFVYWRK